MTVRDWVQQVRRDGDEKFVGRNDDRIDHAEYAARTGYETRQLRRVLDEYAPADAQASVEVGAAYGRLVTTIQPFADQHIAVEPRDGPRSRIGQLYPGVDARKGVASNLPIDGDAVDLLVTWVVLQHVGPEQFPAALDEIDRVVGDRGVVVCCEETDPSVSDGVGTFARSVADYRDSFESFDLVHTEAREVEPTFERDDAGTVMVFRK